VVLLSPAPKSSGEQLLDFLLVLLLLLNLINFHAISAVPALKGFAGQPKILISSCSVTRKKKKTA